MGNLKLAEGLILLDKPAGITSFGVIETLKQILIRAGYEKRKLPRLGHGGTLDPFATGLLIILVGKSTKLSRYFLESTKAYEARVRFGETTIPGDPTSEITERTDNIPSSLAELREHARQMREAAYLQVPPMHSAKKKNGRPLYELARKGIEIEREPVECKLYEFEIKNYERPHADIYVKCSSGTYVRTLAQDFAKRQESLALLETLRRVGSGTFRIHEACTLEDIEQSLSQGKCWSSLQAFVPFDRALDLFTPIDATEEEAIALQCGKQNILPQITARLSTQESDVACIYSKERLIAILRREENSPIWGLERVFSTAEQNRPNP